MWDEALASSRLLEPLDIVELRLGSNVGSCGQPENWTFLSPPKGEHYRIVGHASHDRSIQKRIATLSELDMYSGLIFGSSDKAISHIVIERNPIESSLCIVKPRYLRWQRDRNYKGYPCIEGYLDLGRNLTRHVLRLTDVKWERMLLEITLGEPIIEHEDIPEITPTIETYLTISLGDVFPRTGLHYKLIAGVLLLPKI